METYNKKLTHSLPAKCVAFFLCVLFALAAMFSALGAFYLYEDGYYSGERTTYAESSLCHSAMSNYADAAGNRYYFSKLPTSSGGYSTEHYDQLLDPARTNYRYAIYNEAGERVAGTAAELGPLDEARWHCAVLRWSREGGEDIEVLSTLDPAMAVDDGFAVQNRLFGILLAMRDWLIALGILALLIAVALFIFLLCAAGHYADADAPECRNLDRAPFDLYLAVCIGLIIALFYVVWSFASSLGLVALGVLTALALAGSGVLLIALSMSFAARIKCRNLFHNTVIAWCLRLVWRFIKWCCRGLRTLFLNLPVLWRALLAVCAFLLLDLILLLTGRHSALCALLFAVLNIAAVVFVCAAALQMRRVQAGAQALADGDFTRAPDTKGPLPALRQLSETLGGIGAGMGRAVEARMKSERMKTDLITNVSHDLKTPLTSIVNYVDLLKKESLPAPADEYVAVLERQAQRLRKLSEDVVEASKASSGALNVNLQPTDLGELVNQSMAEYTLRFTENGLVPVVTLPDAPLLAPADGRLLWRALDNLLSNAAKYALTGTRVYVEARRDADKARLSVKNVSREPLNIDPAELTERFVRGDSSRSAEGSGLGLSIAQSLVTLQNGTLVLSIDGDLFKAEISLTAL